jgi:HSP20 family protein
MTTQLDPTHPDSNQDLAAAPARVVRPLCDVYESLDEVRISVELPGVSLDDVQLDVEDGVLSVRGDRTLRSSRFRYERRFRLGESVDVPRIVADGGDGVLVITLPKIAAARPRRIHIGSAAA